MNILTVGIDVHIFHYLFTWNVFICDAYYGRIRWVTYSMNFQVLWEHLDANIKKFPISTGFFFVFVHLLRA